MIVADTTLVIAALVPHPRREIARRCLERDADWIAPASLRVEFVNVLVQMLRRGEVMLGDATLAIDVLPAAVRFIELRPAAEVLALALQQRLTGYDAEFLALAMAEQLRVVSDDVEFMERSPPRSAVLMASFAAGQ